MPVDKWYNIFLFIPCEWSVDTQIDEKKKKQNKRPTDIISYRYRRRHFSSHSFFCSFVFFFLYTRVYNNVDEGSSSKSSSSVGSQPTYIEKIFLKNTHTHKSNKKKEKKEKSNVVCCKMYVLSFSVFRMPLTS